MAAPFPHEAHDSLWKAIDEIRSDLHETKEGVAYIKGKLDGNQAKDDKKSAWKQGVGITAISAGLFGFVELIKHLTGLN